MNGSNMSDISSTAESSFNSSESGKDSVISSLTENSNGSSLLEKNEKSPENSMSHPEEKSKSVDERLADLLNRTKVCSIEKVIKVTHVFAKKNCLRRNTSILSNFHIKYCTSTRMFKEMAKESMAVHLPTGKEATQPKEARSLLEKYPMIYLKMSLFPFLRR